MIKTQLSVSLGSCVTDREDGGEAWIGGVQ
jgi:hypothetical protein